MLREGGSAREGGGGGRTDGPAPGSRSHSLVGRALPPALQPCPLLGTSLPTTTTWKHHPETVRTSPPPAGPRHVQVGPSQPWHSVGGLQDRGANPGRSGERSLESRRGRSPRLAAGKGRRRPSELSRIGDLRCASPGSSQRDPPGRPVEDPQGRGSVTVVWQMLVEPVAESDGVLSSGLWRALDGGHGASCPSSADVGPRRGHSWPTVLLSPEPSGAM